VESKGKEDSDAQDQPRLGKKSSALKWLLIVLGGAITIAGTSAAGAAFGPTLVAHAHGAAKPPAAESAESKEEPPATEPAELEPIVVDLREKDGELHHLKVGIAIELAKPMPEEELKRYVPRARDAAIGYLRSLGFDEVTSPARYDGIRTELGERIALAIGKSRVHRVLFTDFVAQ
jgi:flagellar basal body-associated protein FliL